ncbi:M20/M25/M40 family metallo-hydrolase [Salsuginibacillus halophilus]|nr:M20/M25/M40 family metallo-hydrolase [Salsuginibacillus halophilus]
MEKTRLQPNELYHRIKGLDTPEQIEVITSQLVRIESVNSTAGETEIADYIAAFIKEIPYFKKHPGKVWEQALEDDPLKRKNVFAFVEGQGSSTETVVYHAHLDTVGVDDFGALKDVAVHPEALKEHFAHHAEDPEVKAAATSGDWMFGRGSVDMKSGIAVHLTNIIHFSEYVEDVSGNILVMINPVEENEHTGVMASVAELLKLKDELGLSYQAAINNDFVTELYKGDMNRYVYTGAVGKLLPCFYMYGRAAHVGETLTGVDPTLISSEINREMNNNMALAEELEGELVLPPSCLYQRDNKDFYNVQTTVSSRLYFNYFIYERTPKQVMDQLKETAAQACAKVKTHMHAQYEAFRTLTGHPDSRFEWKVDVYSYEEYIEALVQDGVDVEAVTASVLKKSETTDKRELCFEMLEALQEADPSSQPKVVIFFAPPFCPHNYLRESIGAEKELIDVLQGVLSDQQEKTGEQFALKKFFPFLSDSSYLSSHDTDEELKALIHNFPEWEQIYPVPMDHIRELNIPSITIGVYGKDAHKHTERVYKPYTFGVLPHVIRDFTKQVLNP